MKFKQTLFICILSVVGFSANAQLVAFVGKDSNTPDEFSFVALSDIPASTNIYFTNRDWDNSTGTFVGAKGTLLFTSMAVISKGTVTQITEITSNSFSVTGGSGTASINDGSWSAFGADPHYAFSTNNPGSPFNNVTEVHAFLNTDVTMASMNPTTGTNNSANAMVLDFGASTVAIDYNADRTAATKADLTNTANYLTGASIALDLTAFTNSALPVELQSFEIE